MDGLALDYGLSSEFKEAREQHQLTYMRRREARVGVSATEVLSSWNGLARALRLAGNYLAARDVGEDALDFGRVELSAEHYVTLRTATDLSIALRHIATAQQDALELAAETRDRCEALFGPGSPDTSAAAISLANIQRTIGRIDEALTLAESVAARYLSLYGPEHPYSYGCSGNLALMRRITGDPAAARSLNEDARGRSRDETRPRSLLFTGRRHQPGQRPLRARRYGRGTHAQPRHADPIAPPAG